MEWTPIIVAAVSGLIAGSFGAIVAPWANWGIETKRERVQSRQNLIKAARELVQRSVTKEGFRESIEYATLRPHLSKEARDWIENDTITLQLGGRGHGADNFGPMILDEITRLEKKWKLI